MAFSWSRNQVVVVSGMANTTAMAASFTQIRAGSDGRHPRAGPGRAEPCSRRGIGPEGTDEGDSVRSRSLGGVVIVGTATPRPTPRRGVRLMNRQNRRRVQQSAVPYVGFVALCQCPLRPATRPGARPG